MDNVNGTDPQLRQGIRDEEHLSLLRIAYFVFGGTRVFFSLFGVMYMVIGVVFAFTIPTGPMKPGEAPPPEFVRWIFLIIGTGIFSVMATLATLDFLVAVRLGQRRSRTLCLVAAALGCIFMPWGTLLGVCTFVVLLRPSVATLFASGAAGAVMPREPAREPPVEPMIGAPAAMERTPPPPTGSQAVPVEKGDSTGGIIPYKNPPALAAYYCGIFSLIPCVGLILGIVAVILGVRGLRRRMQHPLVRGQVHAWIGIILGSLVVAVHVLVVIGLATHAFG